MVYYSTTYNNDAVYNNVARSLARRQSYTLGSPPTFTPSNEHLNRFQSASEPPPATTPPLQHHTPTPDTLSVSALEGEGSFWPQLAPTQWWLAPPVQLSSYDNDAYPGDLEIFGSNHDVLDGYPPSSQSRTWEGYCQYHSSACQPNHYRPPPPTPPSTPTTNLDQPLGAVPDDASIRRTENEWGTLPALPRTPPSFKTAQTNNHSTGYSPPPPSTLSSIPNSVADNVGFVRAGLVKVETGVVVPPNKIVSNKKANSGPNSANTNKFRPTREAKIVNSSRSNQLGLDECPSSGFTTVERDSIFYKPQAGRNDIESGPPQKTMKNGNQGKRYDLDEDPRLSASTSLVPKTSSSKRKMENEDEDEETSPTPPSKKQRQRNRTLERPISGLSNNNASSSRLMLETFKGLNNEHTSL